MSGSRPVVFIGPSLPLEDARRLLDADYLPPAEQGAVYDAAVRFRPGVIAIVDGAFARVPAVRHKEILFAIDRGIAVVGAASLGALRAAELHGHGMVGHGLIYRWYRRTPFADDDEVAVAMAPPELSSKSLSEALVNIRVTLGRAERQGIVSGDLRRRLVEIARETHFLDRTYERILLRAAQVAPRWAARSLNDVAAWLADNAFDQKSADAAGLLRWLAAKPQPDARGLSRFVWTEAFVHDILAAGLDLPPEISVK